MNEIITIILAIVGAGLIGFIGALMIGTKTTLNYLKVKISRGKKVLVFLRTPFGWTTLPAVKDENTLKWTHDKKPYITQIDNDKDISKYILVNSAFIDLKTPTEVLKSEEGKIYPKDFDAQTYNNILIRAITRPNFDSTNELKKMIMVTLIIAVLTALGVLMTYVKLNDIVKAMAGGVI